LLSFQQLRYRFAARASRISREGTTMMANFERHSRIFIVRLWAEERETDILLLRGMVRNVESGETRYFRQWQEFVAFMDKERQLAKPADSEKADSEASGSEESETEGSEPKGPEARKGEKSAPE
jgi:hypothetical protein